MGRARLPMALITKQKARNTTFQKRKKGVLKKAYELSVLCNVDVCVIIYGYNKNDGQPEIWPPCPRKVEEIIRRYMSVSEEDQNKRARNLFDVLEVKKKKAEQDLSKLKQKALENKYPLWHARLDTFDRDQLRELLADLVQKLGAVQQRVAVLRRNQTSMQTMDNNAMSTPSSSITNNDNNHNANGYGPYGNESSLGELLSLELAPFCAYASSLGYNNCTKTHNLGLKSVSYDPIPTQNQTMSLIMNDANLGGTAASNTMPFWYSAGTSNYNQKTSLIQNPTTSLTMNDADLGTALVSSSSYTTMPYTYLEGTSHYNQMMMSLIQKNPTMSLMMNDADLAAPVVSSNYTTMPYGYLAGRNYYNQTMSPVQGPTMSLMMNDPDLAAPVVSSNYTTMPYGYLAGRNYYNQTMSPVQGPTMSLMMNDPDLVGASLSKSYPTMSYEDSVGTSYYNQASGMVDT